MSEKTIPYYYSKQFNMYSQFQFSSEVVPALRVGLRTRLADFYVEVTPYGKLCYTNNQRTVEPTEAHREIMRRFGI